MIREMKNAVRAADKAAQYDECAKRLLGQKSILAHILVKTVDEFKGMKPKEVIPYIEGEPYISRVSTEPGLTNTASPKSGQRVVGLNTENAEVNEGMIRFDIIFYVRMKDGLSKMLINVEAQKDEPEKYEILNRAVYYVCRMVSSQKERDFEHIDYDNIKRVYSIWVCMNMSQNSMNHIHLTNDRKLGDYEWKGNLDLINIVMLGLGRRIPEHEEEYELHRLLGVLLSKELSVSKKIEIMESEYDIPLEENLGEDVNIMCNLGQGIMEEGIAIGTELGKEIGVELGKEIGTELGVALKLKELIRKKMEKGQSVEEIAEALEEDTETISEMIKEMKSQ